MIVILRAGHRIDRDKRVTTHVALVARVFGADKILVTTKDSTLEKTIRSVCHRFGGNFEIATGVNAKQVIDQWKGTIIHLTMYGEELETAVSKINSKDDLLIIVGSEKVPAYFYEAADFNIAVGNQPHSEVAAVAIFLDRITQGVWSTKKFHGTLEILPSQRGKIVVAQQRK